jgi:hypothetical protein
MIEDRSLFVQPEQSIKTEWIDIDRCLLGNRTRMDFAAIERSGRRYLQSGDGQIWPPPNGHWQGERFVICDGRHEYLALMALGKTKILVAWIEETA